MTQDTLPERQTTLPQTPPRSGRKKNAARVWRIVGNVLFYLVMALVLVGAFWFSRSKDPTKSIFGFRFYYIQTPSMEPEIPVGSAIFTRYTDPENIRVGDVITYYLEDTSISHLVPHQRHCQCGARSPAGAGGCGGRVGGPGHSAAGLCDVLGWQPHFPDAVDLCADLHSVCPDRQAAAAGQAAARR